MIFKKPEEEKENYVHVVNVIKYQILEHKIISDDEEFYNVVAAIDSEGNLHTIELNDCKISHDVKELKGAFLEETEYSDETFSQRIFR